MTPTKKFKGKSPLVKLKNKLWNTLRQYVFDRDSKDGKIDCYTCTQKDIQGSNRQLGHFITGSTCPVDLYFDPRNLHFQCHSCNCYKSGNWVVYERNMLRDYGEEVVNEMKNHRFTAVKWYAGDYERVIASLQ